MAKLRFAQAGVTAIHTAMCRTRGGILNRLGCHWFDLMRYLAGAEVVRVAAIEGNVGGDAIDVEDARPAPEVAGYGCEARLRGLDRAMPNYFLKLHEAARESARSGQATAPVY